MEEKSLKTADLAGPLSSVVKQKCPQIDLLVAVVERKEAAQVLEMVTPLAENLGRSIEEVCCLSPHPLSPDLGSERWRILTTHGSVEVESFEGEFKVDIRKEHLSPQDNLSYRQLADFRTELIRRLSNSPKNGEAPYVKIGGNVLLCGDFSLWSVASLVGLQKIFFANGAGDVFFVTPTIRSTYCRELTKMGCQIIRLHPPELKTPLRQQGTA